METKGDCPEPEESGGGPLVEEGAPSWTVTFGDMMSLLLTFFILLFSMSELKMDKFLLASQSMREALGGTALEDMDDPMGLMPDPVDPDLKLQAPGSMETASFDEVSEEEKEAWLTEFSDDYLEMIRQTLQEFVDENELDPTVQVSREEDGVYLRMETVALFGSGEHVIRTEGSEVLLSLGRIIRGLDVEVVVSGHADNRPIAGGIFASNWELSAARAAGVARILVDDGHEPTMIRVESYGEFKPIAGNETAEGRARNRRVEFFYSRDDVREAALRWAEEEGHLIDVSSGDTGDSASLNEPPTTQTQPADTSGR